jgi:hypothetical protein
MRWQTAASSDVETIGAIVALLAESDIISAGSLVQGRCGWQEPQ